MYTYIVIDDESLIRKGTTIKLSPWRNRLPVLEKLITAKLESN